MHICHGGHGCEGEGCSCPCHFQRPRRRRLYGLFRKEGRRWVRVPEAASIALPKESAVRYFQSAMLAGFGQLRPIS